MSFLNQPFSEWSPYLFILLAGAIPTQIWRFLAAFISQSMDIANLVLFPSGGLAVVPLTARVGALLIGYAVYWKTRPRLILGILTGEAILIGSTLFYA